MENVGQRPEYTELHLLTEWGEPGDGPRRRRAAALSLVAHAAFIAFLGFASDTLFAPMRFRSATGYVTPLVEPLTALTQRDPSRAKLTSEFEAAASLPHRRVWSPPPGTPGSPAARKTDTPPPPPVRSMEAPPEPKKLGTPVAPPDLPVLMQPRIQTAERPASPFEDPTPAAPYEPGKGLPLPKISPTDALREALTGRGGGGSGASSPAAPASQESSMQLLSNPGGVDFKAFIAALQIKVNRYWQAILPSVRLASDGKVSLEITIERNGRVANLRYAQQSGQQALDRAAVAAISGSVPFPQFPPGYKEATVTLRINFTYHLPK